MSDKVTVISYYDNENDTNTLEGLSREETQQIFDIVQKQFDKGIRVKIRYLSYDPDTKELLKTVL